MAEKLALVESLLNCPHCQETFIDPVSLSCKHSFCSKCLQNLWEDSQSKNCPLCQRRSSKDLPDVNFALKELADTFADRQSGPSEKSGSSTTVEEVMMELVCGKHKAKKMFCEDEQKALCAVCEFSLHEDHKLVPLEEAVRGLKEQLKSDLRALKDKKKKYGQVAEKYSEAIPLSMMQALSAERKIREEFDHRRSILNTEEKVKVADLWEEEEQKRTTVIREMKRVQEKMSSLSSSIDAVEEDLHKDTVAFLNSYKGSQSRARDLCSQPDPQLAPRALIYEAKHLDSQFLRREQMIRRRAYLGQQERSPYSSLRTQYPNLSRTPPSTSTSHVVPSYEPTRAEIKTPAPFI
ncbi:E3 ubiquitin-protein ligase TRIM35-like [Nelusetta ayraudi]|uniref:E3 ubiquitin-protein ligase TRIM35-like n=1 Tax=Nelusetta ayraudi TaxID=303726 RepID=UPI003F72B96A